MADALYISATFLNPQFHGRAAGGDAEWPPLPLRLFQDLIAGSADEIAETSDLTEALTRLEQQPPPAIVDPRVRKGASYRLSVPNNAMDVVARSWSRGNCFGNGDARPVTHKTMKTVSLQCLLEDETVRYLWPLDSQYRPEDRLLRLRPLPALGWGIDLVVGNALVISQESPDAPSD
ncbi:type I-G CRISPR-associated protein Csb2 [Bremerella alba]|uniref:Uncharacterized protein n=1 Tax=Bremerella alba TaxID=980252 RepID=A0A7V8V2M6_9BACT|nr:type I-U CRISPR-associated protein Csb2 [Bremerella alba]MBA2113809.1 hypothetical protein [Bremerella alba]